MLRRALTFVLFTVPLIAQVPSDRPSVSTSGSAEVRVVPDRIEISIGVETVDPDLHKAKAANDHAVSNVIAAAKKRGVDASKIQTDYINIEPTYEDSAQQRVKGYVVRKSVVIESSDIDGFEKLLSALLDSGANHVHSIRFMTSELRKHRDAARAMATQAAREKAQLLAESLGRKVGRVRTISEVSDNWWSSYNSWWGGWGGRWGAYQNSVQNAASAPSSGGDSEGATAPGRISVTASVQVTFDLE